MNEKTLKIKGVFIKDASNRTVLKVDKGGFIRDTSNRTVLKVDKGGFIRDTSNRTVLKVKSGVVSDSSNRTVLRIKGDLIKDSSNNTVLKISNNKISKKGNVPIGTAEVIAVLVAAGKIKSGKSGCFIATATMGDYDHPVVIQLREFRDQYLLDRDWGKKFTKYYYKFGPYPAKVISKSNLLKKVSYVFIVKPLSFVAQKIMNHKKWLC